MTENTEETRDEAEQTNGTDADAAAETNAQSQDEQSIEAVADETADKAAEEVTEEAPEPEVLPEPLQRVVDGIREQYPEVNIVSKADGWLEVNVDPNQATQFFSFVKETPELAFDYLSDLTAVDYEDKGFQVVYHLIAIGTKATNVGRKLVVKIDVPRDKPHVPTSVNVWPTANFHEREVYDMFGVIFDDHPDLRRILMREDWVGHPLRKDYVDERPPRPRVVKK